MSKKLKKTDISGLFSRADGAFIFIVTVDGKQHRKTVKGLSKAQASRELYHWREYLNDKFSPQARQTLDFVFDEHIELVRYSQALQTIRTKLSYYNKHIKPLFGHLRIDRPTIKDYQIFCNNLLETGLKPKSVKEILFVISAIYSHAIKHSYIDYNPIKSVILPKFDNERGFSISNREFETFIEAVNSQHIFIRALFTFLLHGRRLNEVLTITWSDINLITGYYTIRTENNKARRNMEYLATSHLIETLKELKAYYATNSPCKKKTDLVFHSSATCDKLSDIKSRFNRLKKDWEYYLGYPAPKMRVHDIRHLIGDISINRLNLPIEKVSHALGHTNIATTQKYVKKRATSSYEVVSAFLGLGNA